MRGTLQRIFSGLALALGAGMSGWAQAATSAQPHWAPLDSISAADTAWMMTATALVLFMTLPGIALFYAGMVRRKNVLNTMASVVVVAAIVSVLWFAVGYSLAFTPGSTWVGGLERLWFSGLDYDLAGARLSVSHVAPHLPESVYAMFQLSFAIITAALIVGAFVERMRFSALVVFISLWTLAIYAPIAHWVWEPGGWLAQLGALDFAGGSVVHVNAGMAGLACAWFLGKRHGYGREPFEPYNLGWTMVGAGMLWIGWFGFNAGSAVAADGRAGLAFAVTHIAAAAGALAWMAGEWWLRGRPSLLGLCSGLVAGLVAITPAAGFVTGHWGHRGAGLLLGGHGPQALVGHGRLARRVRRARHWRHRGFVAHGGVCQSGHLGCNGQCAHPGHGRGGGDAVQLCGHSGAAVDHGSHRGTACGRDQRVAWPRRSAAP
jgi:Amt family ammonium transporter